METTDLRAVVLVEGLSDQAALEALAARRGRDLAAEGVRVVPIGGAQAITRALGEFGPQGLGITVAGLCDAGEARDYARGLERVGLGSDLGRDDMARLGFYVCEADLADELVRALGVAGVEEVIAAEGERAAFQTFQKQVTKRDLPIDAQLHGFMWNRKIRYARLLVEALDLARVPRPLDGVLAHVEA